MVQHSDIAKSAMAQSSSGESSPREQQQPNGVSANGTPGKDATLMPQKTVVGRALGDSHKPLQATKDGVGFTLSDTPISTAPPSPQMYVPPGFPSV